MTNAVEELPVPLGGADGLNFFLRAELSAVKAYQRALRSADHRKTVDAAEILRFAAGHQRTVAALQVTVWEMGGVPTSEAGTWGAFAGLRDTATLGELRGGEEAGLRMYEEASDGFDGDARDLVTLELIPRQRKHIADLSAIIARLTA